MWKRIVFLLTFLAISPATQAAPLSIYVGGSLGTGIDLDGGDFGLSDFGANSDDQSWKLFGGVGIGRIFGVEAAWHDLGTTDCCEGLSDAGFRLDLQGVSVVAVVGIPITRLRLFAKVGLFAWEADGEILTIGGGLPISLEGEDPMAGVGVDLKVWKNFSVRAELEVFKIDEGTLDSVSAGVQYRF